MLLWNFDVAFFCLELQVSSLRKVESRKVARVRLLRYCSLVCNINDITISLFVWVLGNKLLLVWHIMLA